MVQMKYSLVIPCYNEEKNLQPLINRCQSSFKGCKNVEIILVDNGSTDDTPSLLADLISGIDYCRSIRVPVNEGYGNGILAGLKVATGDVIGWTHADLQTDPSDLLQAIDVFEKFGPDIFVKGSRQGRPVGDVFFTFCMSIFETILLKKVMFDINAQPTLFSRGLYEKFATPPKDFSLDLYAYYLAKKFGFKVCRFPVKFGPRAFGISHWNINWAAKIKFIKRTFAYSFTLKRGLN